MLMRAPQRRRNRQRVAQATTVPAPVGGWNSKAPLAGMDPLSAVQLKNFFPQPGYVEVRKGFKDHAWDIGSAVKTVSAIDTGTDTFTSTGHGMSNGDLVKFHATTTLPAPIVANNSFYVINATTDEFQISESSGGSAVNITSAGSGTIYVYELTEPAVETLAVWQGPASSKMLAAAGGAFWDVTANVAATLSHPAGASDDAWQWCAHTTSGGSYTFFVNGSDAPVHYSGSAWAAPTITGITASDAIGVISHKKRLWFVLNGTTQGAYLATDAIAGAATTFEFGSLFTRGGYLNALATWTRDGGSGSDDYLVAISSRGQVAIYQGTDPASADTWELVGVFDVPPPIGRRCFHRYGADLLLITLEGVFPLSTLLSVDQSQVSRVAITDNIAPSFADAARFYGSNWGWEVCTYPRGTRLIVNIPTTELTTAKQYVMNTISGAWCEFDSHNATCWVVYNDLIYFGAPAGAVYQADTGSADVDQPITAVGQCAYSAFGAPNLKRFSMIRPLVSVTGQNRPNVGISTDFVETSSLSSIPVSPFTSGAVWDTAVWDNATWSELSLEVSDWSNLVGLGTFGSIKFTAQTGISSGGGAWGVGLWGSLLWGSQGRADEQMRVQGFVLTFEPGEYV
jgi:hypothetical protein